MRRETILSHTQKNILLSVMAVMIVVLGMIFLRLQVQQSHATSRLKSAQSSVDFVLQAPTQQEFEARLRQVKGSVLARSSQRLGANTAKADWLDCAQAMARWEINALDARARCNDFGPAGLPIDYMCGAIEQQLGEDLALVAEACGLIQ